MFVEDYMTFNPHTIAPGEYINHAHHLMQNNHIHHLPVVDRANRLVGILSDRDVRSAIVFDETRQAKLSVSEIMTPEPATISVSGTLDDALTTFCAHRFGALPVVRFNKLVGILCRSDLLRAFYQVLGLDVPGQRMEVALPNGCEDLARAFTSLISDSDVLISVVMSRMRRDGGEPSLYLRVVSDQAKKIEKQLREATLIVLELEHP